MVKHKVVISRYSFPVDGYKWNAQVLTSIDNGKTWYYGGNGKFYKTRKEARDFRDQMKKEWGEV